MPVAIIHHVNVVLMRKIMGRFLKISVLEIIVLCWLLVWLYNIFFSAIHPISRLLCPFLIFWTSEGKVINTFQKYEKF